MTLESRAIELGEYIVDVEGRVTTLEAGGGGSSATERDIYRPALVMSPASVTAFGGSMVNGVSLTIAALASSIPVGQDILIWNGTNGGAPNGSYTHAGSGNFTYATRQYLNTSSFKNGCVEVSSNDYATTNADGEVSRWAIATTNGTDFGLDPTGGQAFRLTYGPSSPTDGRPAVFDATEGKWLKEGTAIGGDLANAADAASARSVLGLGTSATVNTGTGSGDVILGNDSRLTDARTPTAHTHAAADVTSGTMATARLGSGTANSTTFLRGDQTYAAPTVDVVSNVATSRILGRTTAGSGDSEELTIAQTRTLLATSWVRIADRTIATGGSASESFDVTGYTMVQILFAGASERNATTAALFCTFNSDTSSVYSTDAGALTTSLTIGSIPGNATNTNRFGMVRADLQLIDGFYKTGASTSTNIGSTASVGAATVDRGLMSTITGAVTSIQLTTQGPADIAAGSRIIVLGM